MSRDNFSEIYQRMKEVETTATRLETIIGENGGDGLRGEVCELQTRTDSIMNQMVEWRSSFKIIVILGNFVLPIITSIVTAIILNKIFHSP